MVSHTPFIRYCFSSLSPLCLLQAALPSSSQAPLCDAQQNIMTAEADQTNIFGGFAAVLGYIGAEAATVEWFERLLWPQRFFSGFRAASVPSIALLLPMGGPLHKAALDTLDRAYNHGLFRGAHRGHMLGTPFFHALDWTYTMHGDVEHETHTEPLRNCLWARALALIPTVEQAVSAGPGDEEKGRRKQILRAQVAVNHLTLSAPKPQDIHTLPFVSEPADTPTLRVFAGIITAEVTGILFAVVQAIAYRTTWCILFLLPLLLRLFSASLALRREKLVSVSSAAVATDPPLDFEVHCPQSDGSFMLLTGPPALVLQFVRHFGHPVRSRWRELAQLGTVTTFGALFPIGLLCSMVWMPLRVQCVWLSYQMYLVVAMHVARYTQSGLGSTTESRIAKTLAFEAAKLDDNGERREEVSILFGHERKGEGTVKATWKVSHCSRNLEGKKEMEKLLRRRQTVSVALKEERRRPCLQTSGTLAEEGVAAPTSTHLRSDTTDSTCSSRSDVTLVHGSDSGEAAG